MVEQELTGRYVYCVIDTGKSINLGKIGIEEKEVYTIPHSDISAIVHSCLPKAYESKDENAIINYVQKHNSVVDLVFNKFDTAVPLRFNTIMKEKDNKTNEATQKWLEEQYPNLKRKLSEFRGKQEYSVQVFIDKEKLRHDILEQSQRIIELKKKIETAKSPGYAYMYEQTFETTIKEELEERSRGISKEVQALIKNYSTDMRVEKTKKAEGKTMVLNISCLVQKENAQQFREELEKMEGPNNLSIRITGPWAPYSFV